MLKQFKLGILFEIDTEYWSIIPSINVNLHKKILEIEWLCLGMYIGELDD